MKRFAKYLPAACLCAAAAVTPATAQELRSSYFQQTSNYRHQMNPALLDQPYVGVLLGNFNVGLTGNMGAKKFIYKVDPSTGYDLATFMHPSVGASEFLDELKDKNRLDLYINWNLFSVGFNGFGGTNLVELNLRSNTNVTLPKTLFEFMKTAGAQEEYDIEDLGVRNQSYLELALGHARDINERLRVGAKVKFLIGAAYADLSSDKLHLTMNDDLWRIQGDVNVKTALGDSEWEYDEDANLSADGRQRVDGLDYNFSLPGFGLAFDLGASYKLMDGLTLSAGLTDLGFISWKNVMKASSAGDYTFDGFDNIYMGSNNTGDNKIGDQFEQLGDDLEDMFAVYDDGTGGSETSALAATLNIGAEYELPYYRKLRFGFLYTSRINGLYSWHEGMLSANVRPVKWLEATVNTSVSSTGWGWGGLINFHTPHFNFYVGADRFLGKLAKQGVPLNNSNGNVNFGFTFPL